MPRGRAPSRHFDGRRWCWGCDTRRAMSAISDLREVGARAAGVPAHAAVKWVRLLASSRPRWPRHPAIAEVCAAIPVRASPCSWWANSPPLSQVSVRRPAAARHGSATRAGARSPAPLPRRRRASVSRLGSILQVSSALPALAEVHHVAFPVSRSRCEDWPFSGRAWIGTRFATSRRRDLRAAAPVPPPLAARRAGQAAPPCVPRGSRRSGRWTRRRSCARLLRAPSFPRSARETIPWQGRSPRGS